MPSFLKATLQNKEKCRGVSLVELLLVIASVGILMLLLANLPNSIRLIGKAKHQSLAREIATKQIEDKRELLFTNLANGEQSINDLRMSLLPGGTGKVTISDCSFSVCTNGENAKQVSIIITWKEASKDQSLVINTLIAEGGL